MAESFKPRRVMTPGGIAAVYGAVGAVWIALSDIAAGALFPEALQPWVQTFKGWLYVAATAILIYVLVRRLVLRLRRGEERLAAIAGNSPMAIAVRDLDGRYNFVNSEFEALHRVRRKDVLGVSVGTLDPDFAAIADAALARVARNGEAYRQEVRRAAPDGGETALLLTHFPIRDDDGRVVGIGVGSGRHHGTAAVRARSRAARSAAFDGVRRHP